MTEVEIFKKAINEHAKFMGWDTDETADDEFAGFSFELGKDNEVDVDFFLNEDRVDIAVSGSALVDDQADIPDEFSTLLMRRSDDLMYGSWTLAETEDGKFQYRLLWTLDLDQFARTPKEKFQKIIEAMIDEAGEVNEIWEEEY